MTSREFCYWLQGYFEITGESSVANGASPGTMKMIKNHLDLVFYHEIDKSYSEDQKVQDKMNSIHNGPIQIGGKDSEGNLMRC